MSASETSDLTLSGDPVQTFKNCDAKHGRTLNSFAADLDKSLARDWKELWLRILVETWEL